MELRPFVKDFLGYCAIERRLSKHTVQAYACDLGDFASWHCKSTLTSDVTTEVLKAYLQWMIAERKLSPATVRRRMACLRAFYRRLSDRGIAPDPFAGWRLALPKRKRLPKALSRSEIS